MEAGWEAAAKLTGSGDWPLPLAPPPIEPWGQSVCRLALGEVARRARAKNPGDRVRGARRRAESIAPGLAFRKRRPLAVHGPPSAKRVRAPRAGAGDGPRSTRCLDRPRPRA